MSAFIVFLVNASAIFWLIMLLSLLMWWLIARSYLQHWWQYPQLCQHYQQAWPDWQGESHRLADAVRAGFVSELHCQLSSRLLMIQTLTGVLPLLGLLGTVDGMIDNFAVLSASVGVSALFNSGIAQALLTTLAGLVTGLSGLWFCHDLHKRVDLCCLDLAKVLTNVANNNKGNK